MFFSYFSPLLFYHPLIQISWVWKQRFNIKYFFHNVRERTHEVSRLPSTSPPTCLSLTFLAAQERESALTELTSIVFSDFSHRKRTFSRSTSAISKCQSNLRERKIPFYKRNSLFLLSRWTPLQKSIFRALLRKK